MFVQKAFLLGLFSGELIFGGAYYCENFVFQNGWDLTIKTASTNTPWAYIREGLLYLRLRFWGLIFGRAYFLFFFLFLFLFCFFWWEEGGVIIGILRYTCIGMALAMLWVSRITFGKSSSLAFGNLRKYSCDLQHVQNK